MTVQQLLTSATSYEIEEWKAFFKIENENHEQRELINRAVAHAQRAKVKKPRKG